VTSGVATDPDLTVVLGVNDDKYDAGSTTSFQRILHHELPWPARYKS
jgi:hypothetical protein